jgi:hypothetical protein
MNDTPTRTRWLIVALIFCMGVLMFIDRVNISIPWKVLLGRADLWFLTASYFVLGYIIYIYFS